MFERNKKNNDKTNQYYMVFAFFTLVCVASIFFTIFNPKVKFTELPVLDEQAMMVHNGMGH